MTYKHPLVLGAFMLLVAAALFVFEIKPSHAQSGTWEAVSETAPIGKGVRIEVRLKGIDPAPAPEDITVTSVEIDMGPDGMAMMKSPIKSVLSTEPGVLAFEADLTMGGRWALTLTATVKGQSAPVSGSVVFNATDKAMSKDAPKAEENSKERKILFYRNPMGLSDTSPTPKKDSMGMDYIPVYEDEAAGPQGSIRLSPDKIQRAGIRTEPVERRVLARAVRGTGTVMADQTGQGEVTARFSGYVEKLFVSETGRAVKRGQPLMQVRIEDPELIQKQAALTTTLIGATRSLSITDVAKRDLQYTYGFPESAIDEIRKTRRPIRTLTLNAPGNGVIVEKSVALGTRFNPGDVLMRTTDFSRVWIVAQIPERDFGQIKMGQTAQVTLRAYPDTPIRGKITLIYPEMDTATRSGLARIELANGDGNLKSGMYADIIIEAKSGAKSVIAVPESAIIDSGMRQVAFVAKDEGRFEPRPVKLGRRGNGYVEIKEGLSEGENIVVTGNFLIDAESNLQSAIATFTNEQAEEQKP